MHTRDHYKWCTAQCAQSDIAIEIAIVANVKYVCTWQVTETGLQVELINPLLNCKISYGH